MTAETRRQMSARMVRSRSPRKRHWRRWILAGVVTFVVLVAAAAAAFIKFQPVPAPLRLPMAAAGAPVGPLDGTWDVAAGSVAGFRVQETILGLSNDAVGRTDAVTGTVAFSGSRVTSAAFRVGLAAIKVGGKPQPQFAQSLGTRDQPFATFALSQPVTMGSAFGSGAAVTATATGLLTMHGASRPVTIKISGRRAGAELQVAGLIPITFSDWGIKGPTGYGVFGSLASDGVAELLLILHRP